MVRCVKAVVELLLLAALFLCLVHLGPALGEGFRSPSEKTRLARMVRNGGAPNRQKFRKMGLGGHEYYDAKQLWRHQSFTVPDIEKIL